MNLDAKIELRIAGKLVTEILAQPSTPPDAMADMLEDAVSCIQEGVETMMEHGDTPCQIEQQDDPPPIEWRYINNTPEATGLSARMELRMSGVLEMQIRFHPRTPMDSMAALLADLAGQLRKDLKSKTPVLTLPQRLHEIDTRDNSPTPPATFTGKSINDRINTAIAKMMIAMDYGDDGLAQKYLDMAEKLYEWQWNNYTAEAIEKGPVTEINK